MENLESILDELEEEGFVTISGALDPDQVADVRQHINAAREKGWEEGLNAVGNMWFDSLLDREPETFGPLVGIMKVKDDGEAIELMNDSDFGLTASLWTKDAERAANVGAQIQTGTVFMNRCDYVDPGLCWVGCKDTGRGGTLSVIGYHNLTRPKSYHLKKT